MKGAQQYLSSLSESGASQKLFIPQEILEGEDFRQALDMYMSSDRKTAEIRIILDVNPYSEEAMHIIKELECRLVLV